MNPLADAGKRRLEQAEGQYLLPWQIALYEAILISAVVGSAWFDLWLSKLMINSGSVIFNFLRVFEDMGDSKWFLVTASCWMLGCLMLLRLTGDTAHRRKLKWLALSQAWLIAAVAVSGILANLFKILFGRARPPYLEDGLSADWSILAFDWTYQSFPSGHTTTLFAAAFVLAALLPRWQRVFWSLAVLGGLGRIAIGAHFFSDIVAGAALGVFTAWWLKHYLARRHVHVGPYAS